MRHQDALRLENAQAYVLRSVKTSMLYDQEIQLIMTNQCTKPECLIDKELLMGL